MAGDRLGLQAIEIMYQTEFVVAEKDTTAVGVLGQSVAGGAGGTMFDEKIAHLQFFTPGLKLFNTLSFVRFDRHKKASTALSAAITGVPLLFEYFGMKNNFHIRTAYGNSREQNRNILS